MPLQHGNARRSGKSPEYASYANMKTRCLSPTHPTYPSYGGRGITVCSRWLGKNGFVNFLTDMGPRLPGMSLDRINSNGNYEPSNCKWSTKIEQVRNRRYFAAPENMPLDVLIAEVNRRMKAADIISPPGFLGRRFMAVR